MSDEKNKKPSEERVELAQRIANQSEKIQRRYQALGNSFARVIRFLSEWFDRIIFNPRHSKMVAFGLAALVFLAFSPSTNVTSTPLQYTKTFTLPVVLDYNSQMYEVSGYDETVDVTVIGDYTDLSMIESQKDFQVILDLTGLSEGVHQVNYTVKGFPARIRTIVTPSRATITIRMKETKTMPLSYEFINMDKLGSQFVLGDPEMAISEVSVKASSETLSKVAFVKALIDVGGQTTRFTTNSIIVAYDAQGNKIDNVDIIPQTVEVTVDVSSPSKTVPIRVGFDDTTIPNNMAVASVSLSNDTITLYGPQNILDSISDVRVIINSERLTEDKRLVQNIVLPAGVKSGSVTQVTIDVRLGPGVTRIIENIPISFKNNINGYKFTTSIEDTMTHVEIFGTQENVNNIDIGSLNPYIDMRNLSVGNNQVVPVHIDNFSLLVTARPLRETIVINIGD